MNLDTTITMGNLLAFFGPIILGLISMVVKTHFTLVTFETTANLKVAQMEKELKIAQDDISVIEITINQEVKKIQESVNQINLSLQHLSTRLETILEKDKVSGK